MDQPIRVTVIPNSKKNAVKEIKPGQLEIRLKAAPVRNEANLVLKEKLAEYYHVALENIQIIAGHHGRHKKIHILTP